jgi:hypothetical protein
MCILPYNGWQHSFAVEREGANENDSGSRGGKYSLASRRPAESMVGGSQLGRITHESAISKGTNACASKL